MRRTKIVCTIGPSTSDPDSLYALMDAGMNVARLNFSHGCHEEHAAIIQAIRSHPLGNSVAILQDLSGPKVRIGEMQGGSVEVNAGDEFILTAEEMIGDSHQATISIPDIIEAVPAGATLLIDDGNVELTVKIVKPDCLVCNVLNSGQIGSHKGVNAPGITLPIAAVTEKDIDDLHFGIQHGVDWVAVSFVRSASDIAAIRTICDASRSRIGIIAKIEKHEAVGCIDEIIAVVDGIMVARGDLGVELPVCEVPVMQKMIIKKCNAVGKPVITATQMLESMIHNPHPTRAEVSDVANAILDGTDALMLSAETAAGAYPLRAVKIMDEIARFTEDSIPVEQTVKIDMSRNTSITQAVGQSACDMARDLNAAAIVTATSSGSTARAVARFRPNRAILALCNRAETLRKLALVWGVSAAIIGEVNNSDQVMQACVNAAENSGVAPPGSVIIITGGFPVGSSGHTNFIRAHRMGSSLCDNTK